MKYERDHPTNTHSDYILNVESYLYNSKIRLPEVIYGYDSITFWHKNNLIKNLCHHFGYGSWSLQKQKTSLTGGPSSPISSLKSFQVVQQQLAIFTLVQNSHIAFIV